MNFKVSSGGDQKNANNQSPPRSSSVLNVSTPNAPCGTIADHCRLSPDDDDGATDRRRSLEDAEKFLAKHLSEVSMKEREDALHDIHGVSDIPRESPDFVLQSKKDLELYLTRNQKQSLAFQTTWNIAPDYIRSLYLTFLRCDSFDIQKAGQRIYLHFDTKLRLFGQDKLGRDITLSDFDSHDMASYKAGFFQVMPLRDRAGRPICVKIWKRQKFHCRENVWRQIWYIHMVILKDEETQLKGLVQIVYNVNDHWRDNFDKELYMGVAKIRSATPVRFVSLHYCFSDPAFGVFIKLVSLALEMHTRTRVRLHYGSDVEVQYELQGFGIPLQSFPVKSDGTVRLKEHAIWITARQSQESYSKEFSGSGVVVVPGHADILFGMGKILQSHLGNLRFSNILAEEMDHYLGAPRAARAVIAKDVVDRLTEDGARFLRQADNGVWEQVDDRTAIDKVGHGFRNRKPAAPIKKVVAVPPMPPKPSADKRPGSLPDATSRILSSKTLQPQTAIYDPYGAQNAQKRFRFNDQDGGKNGEDCAKSS